MLNQNEVHKLLDKLCVSLGFCLSPDHIERLVSDPPSEVLDFTDEVFRADGLDPRVADRHLYRQVRDMVALAFIQSEQEIDIT